jgi:hypothetical protein
MGQTFEGEMTTQLSRAGSLMLLIVVDEKKTFLQPESIMLKEPIQPLRRACHRETFSWAVLDLTRSELGVST